jgi:hypothetical protein
VALPGDDAGRATQGDRVMTEPQNDELTREQQDTCNLLERVLGRAIADRYVDFCRLASGAFELRVSRPVSNPGWSHTCVLHV